MKKLMFASVASLALLVVPAQAQNYGNDAVAWIDLEATAEQFCALTATDPGATVNAEIVDEDTTGSGFEFSDARIRFDLQNLDSPVEANTVAEANTIQAANAVLRFPGSQCNTTFDVTADSEFGALKNDDFTSFDDEFTDEISYRVAVTFDDEVNTGLVTAAPGVFLTSTDHEPTFGLFRVRVNVPASNERMLEGTYEDFLVVQMTPTP